MSATENVGGKTVETTVSAGTTLELNPGFTGDTITLAEAVEVTGKSKVTILKVVKEKGIKAVGYVKSQKRGRPANLFSREEMLSALHSV